MDNASPAPTDLRILAIDVGGTGLKASVLDAEGNPLSERLRVKTPHPLTPAVLLDTLAALVEPLASLNYNRISVGFPGRGAAGDHLHRAEPGHGGLQAASRWPTSFPSGWATPCGSSTTPTCRDWRS